MGLGGIIMDVFTPILEIFVPIIPGNIFPYFFNRP